MHTVKKRELQISLTQNYNDQKNAEINKEQGTRMPHENLW